MKTVSILVPENAVMAAIADPRYMFTAVNGFFKAAGKPEPFKVQMAGLTKEVKLNDGLFSIHPDVLLKDVKHTDLIIVPAIGGDIIKVIKDNDAILPWIIDQYKSGAEVASLCIGAFLLASTGLLNGRQCSTHWSFANLFRQMFPEVIMVDDKMMTDQNGLYSSGGANAYWSLLLYLVEKYTNRETAIMASKYFVLEIGKRSQSSFIMFRGQKDHGDDEIKKAQEFIEEHFSDKITVDRLADQFGIGRRSFERRFKKSTGNTVIEYMQRVKMEAAKKQLEAGRKTVNEVMYEVGYTDTKAFRDVFKKIAGMSPVDYRNKYNKEMVV